MKKLINLFTIIALLAFTACSEDETNCIEIPAQPNIIEPSCEKCFINDDDYSDWFNRCWFYALQVQDITDPIQMQAAADSLCACE